MPSFRKLDAAELLALAAWPPSERVGIAQEYDALLEGFTIGDHGRAELIDGERRVTVRQRLQAAARRRGLKLRFRPGRGPLIFRVDVAPPPVARPAPTLAAGAEQRPAGEARSRDTTPRPPRRRQMAAERYHEVLPRWMREGQQPSRREGSKRRQGR